MTRALALLILAGCAPQTLAPPVTAPAAPGGPGGTQNTANGGGGGTTFPGAAPGPARPPPTAVRAE